jgi:signal transduction histidine kinase
VRATSAKMVSSARRMSRMIDDILDLARARLAGGIPLKREPAELGTIIQRVVQEHRATFPDRRINISMTGDLNGDWDADRLAQVASNLIGNALRHGDGVRPIEVALEGSSPGMVALEVGNGGTIPPDLLPSIFDPFRGGGSAAPTEGLGLGLYIVQQIMLAHHGTIDVESGAGRTTFRLRIPRASHDVIRL